MYDAQQAVWDDLTYYFVIQEEDAQLSLSGHAAFAETRKTLPFDSETDAALYLLEEVRKGARASEQDIEIARAIMRGDKAMFVYEEKQPHGTLLLTLHYNLPPRAPGISAFAPPPPPYLPQFL